jgi:hypothetical protein
LPKNRTRSVQVLLYARDEATHEVKSSYVFSFAKCLIDVDEACFDHAGKPDEAMQDP